MKEHLPKDAKILYLEGTPGLSHTQERKKGFEDALGRSDVATLASLSANYDRAEGMKVTEDWIQSFPKFDAIVAANDQMALGALEALQGADRLKGVMISGVDGTADALNAIKAWHHVADHLPGRRRPGEGRLRGRGRPEKRRGCAYRKAGAVCFDHQGQR